MKKVLLAITLIGLAGFPFAIKAQDVLVEKETGAAKIEKDKAPAKKETQEIIIRNKGDKEMNLKVEINGDNITVNGKPLEDFIDNNITINKRKMIIRDGDQMMHFDLGDGPEAFNFDKNFQYNFNVDGDAMGNMNKAFLGVTTEAVVDGVKVVGVSKGSAAEKAGLKNDDIITKIGNEKITSPDGLSDIIGNKKPADEVKVAYKRKGKSSTMKVVLGKRAIQKNKSYTFTSPYPAPHARNMPAMPPLPNMEGFNEAFSGDVFGNIDGADFDGAFGRRKKIGIKLQDTEEGGNVKVINVEDSSAAAIAGLKKDDLITEINGKKIDNTDAAREELMQDEDRKSYKMKVNRAGSEMMFDVKIPRKLKTAEF